MKTYKTLADHMASLPTERRNKIEQRVADTLVSIRLSELPKMPNSPKPSLPTKLACPNPPFAKWKVPTTPNTPPSKKYVQALGGKLIVEIDGKQSVLFD